MCTRVPVTRGNYLRNHGLLNAYVQRWVQCGDSTRAVWRQRAMRAAMEARDPMNIERRKTIAMARTDMWGRP